MNGAQALVATLEAVGVEVCFANPGTTELHLVQALDASRRVASLLCLTEGVATGAADGYARMAGAPAATLLHLGPGLANGLANLHNARRAFSPVLNVVGDSATGHKRLDPPLESDVDALAATVSAAVCRVATPSDVGSATAGAYRAARRPPGGVSTLIVPADASWSEGGAPGAPLPLVGLTPVDPAAVVEVAPLLQHPDTVVLLGGGALTAGGGRAVSRLAASARATFLAEAFPSRMAAGGGLPAVPRLSGDSVRARQQLARARHVVLCGAALPVAAFAEEGRPGELLPSGCVVSHLAGRHEDTVGALDALADLAGGCAPESIRGRPFVRTGEGRPGDALTPVIVGEVIRTVLPEDTIIVEEANTGSAAVPASDPFLPPHDLLTLCGYAIGEGMPLAVGAALACPDRLVLCAEADGSAMFNLPALWTQAREGLRVVTVVLHNRAYAILRREARRRRAGAGDSPLFDLSKPDLDFVRMAGGMGVPGGRAQTRAALAKQLMAAFRSDGPYVIEARLADGAGE